MATFTLSAGQSQPLPSVSLAAGVEQTFPDPASGNVVKTDATCKAVTLNVNLATADALNTSTRILFTVDRSLDDGATWPQLAFSKNEYAGGPQNTKNGTTAMPGMDFGTGSVAAAWRIRVNSATALTTVNEVIAGR